MSYPLLVEINCFAAGKNAYHREEPPESKKIKKILFNVFI